MNFGGITIIQDQFEKVRKLFFKRTYNLIQSPIQSGLKISTKGGFVHANETRPQGGTEAADGNQAAQGPEASKAEGKIPL